MDDISQERVHKVVENLPCPHCRKPIEYTLAHAGRAGKCPSCGEDVRMPGRDLAVLEEVRDLLAKICNMAVVLIILAILQFLLFIVSR